MSDQPLRVVQVGCGGMGRRWLNLTRLIDGLEPVGLVDTQRRAAEALAAEHGLEGGVYDSLSDALRDTKPDIVFDTTVPEAHHDVTIAALDAGCHVLGEKPLSTDMASARRMIEAADRNGRTYAVMQNRRHQGPIRGLAAFLGSGSLGALDEVHADFFLGPHFGGFRDEMDHPLLRDMAIHSFDQARLLSNADPLSVYCHAFNPGRSWYRGQASAVAIFEMTGGLVFTYRGSWCARGLGTSWQCAWRFLLTRGSATWDGGDEVRVQAVAPGEQDGPDAALIDLDAPIEPLRHEAHEAVMRGFVDSIRAGRTPETDCHDNIKSLAMVEAAVQSAATGQKVPVAW